MTAPVPLAEPPTPADAIFYVKQRLDAFVASRKAGRRVGSAIDLEIALQQAVLATLQQHERAMAVVDAAQEWAADIRDAGFLAQTAMAGRPKAVRLFNAVVGYFSLAALDAAANTTGDAVASNTEKTDG